MASGGIILWFILARLITPFVIVNQLHMLVTEFSVEIMKTDHGESQYNLYDWHLILMCNHNFVTTQSLRGELIIIITNYSFLQ